MTSFTDERVEKYLYAMLPEQSAMMQMRLPSALTPMKIAPAGLSLGCPPGASGLTPPGAAPACPPGCWPDCFPSGSRSRRLPDGFCSCGFCS